MAPKQKTAPPSKKAKIVSSSSTASELVPYPLGEPKFANPAYRDIYKDLRSKSFMCSPNIHLPTLEEVGIKDKVLSLLSNGGLQILVDSMDLGQYEIPTREFVTTFEEYEDDDGGGWKFYLANNRFVLSKREVCDLFKFPYSGGFGEEYSPETRDELWKEISGMDMFVPLMLAKHIHDGAWKYIHRLVTLCLFTRKDGGRLVQAQDFDVMVAIWKGLAIDGYHYLTCMFKIWGDPKEENKAISGGVFVSLIAEAVKIDLSTLGAGEFKPFDIKQMVAFEMWRKKPPGWIHKTDLPERVKALLEGRMRKKRKVDARAAREAATPHDSFEWPGGSSSYQGRDDRMDSVISRLTQLEVKVDDYIVESRTQYTNLLAAIQGRGSHIPSSSASPYPPPGSYDYYYGNACPR